MYLRQHTKMTRYSVEEHHLVAALSGANPLNLSMAAILSSQGGNETVALRRSLLGDNIPVIYQSTLSKHLKGLNFQIYLSKLHIFYSTPFWGRVYKSNCKINGTVHIFFLKKSYLSPRCPKLSHFFFLV